MKFFFIFYLFFFFLIYFFLTPLFGRMRRTLRHSLRESFGKVARRQGVAHMGFPTHAVGPLYGANQNGALDQSTSGLPLDPKGLVGQTRYNSQTIGLTHRAQDSYGPLNMGPRDP